jgi:hypothetical protein
MKKTILAGCVAAIACGAAGNAAAGKWWTSSFDTSEAPMMEALEGEYDPVLTVGDEVTGYYAPGKLDGIGAWRRGRNVQVVVNSELSAEEGSLYPLANGTMLRGARVTSLLMDGQKRTIRHAGLAYDTIYDRYGVEVTDPAQVNETGDLENGLGRLCSARSVARGEYGFVDDIFFTGEENGNGTEWALDAKRGELWAAPELGRASWESVAPVDTGDRRTIGLIIGDDIADAPLYYYVGNKRRGGFLERNGLADGQLYCWKSDSGELTPADFNGTGNALAGSWVPLEVRDESMAGMPGYDAQGYKDGDTLRDEADSKGCFSLSRPEDVHENPADPTQVVVASTGRSNLYDGADTWGTLYIIDVDTGDLKILLDNDDPQFRDFGIRSPDNLTWADNGMIYVQEDRSTGERVPKDPAGCDVATDPDACRDLAFGGRSEIEASLWVLDPSKPIVNTTDIKRLAVVDRSAVPPTQVDTDPLDLGDWETSGILDVSKLFRTSPGETLLIGAVQAHSLRGGAIDSEELDEGGQLFFLELGEGKSDKHRKGGDRHDD